MLGRNDGERPGSSFPGDLVLATHPPATRGIPKIIHQTFRSGDQLPPALQENCLAIKELNPEFDYRFYDDQACEAFIQEIYGEAILARYRRIHPSYGAARADLFRYLCLYHHGGVYLDIKARARMSLAGVLKDDDAYILGQWNHSPGSPHVGWGTHRNLRHVHGGEYQQWHIIASPRHPFLAAVIRAVIGNIDSYHPLVFSNSWEAVVCTTGPIVYTETIHAIRDEHPHRLMHDMDELGIAYSIFDATPTPDAHRCLYRDYRTSRTPLIRQPFPLSWLFALLAGLRALMDSIRSQTRRIRLRSPQGS